MKKIRVTLLILCLLGAIGFGGFYLYSSYFGTPENEANKIVLPPVNVLKLEKAVDRNEKINESHIGYVQMSAEAAAALPKTIILSKSDVVGKYAKVSLHSGEYIYPDRLLDKSSGDGLEKVAVNLTPIGAVAGTVKIGDIVTVRAVLSSANPEGGASAPIVLATNVEVADIVNEAWTSKKDFSSTGAVQQTTTTRQAPGATAQTQQSVTGVFVPKYAVLYVTPKQAENIAKYDNTEAIRLAVVE